MTELLTGLSKAEETKDCSSLEMHLKETERLCGSTEDDISSERFDSSFSSPRKSSSVRGNAASSKVSSTMLDPLFSSPKADGNRQVGTTKKRMAVTEWAEKIKLRAQHTSFSGRLSSQTSSKVERQIARTKVKVHLKSEQVQELLEKMSLGEQSRQMTKVAVSKTTGSQGKKLGKIEKSREVI